MIRAGVAGLAAASLLLAGCTSNDKPDAGPETSGPATAIAHDGGTDTQVDDPALDAALSTPLEDSVYPDIGDPGVDALHYDLDLNWAPRTKTLDALETLVFRSTADAEQFQLDFSHALTASSVTVDGAAVEFEQIGKDLVVHTPVNADQRYTLEIAYAGTPKPAAAPTTRSDFSTTGWTITKDNEAWTMQEPYGAFTWYAVNDQPSDKALYDFTISVPSPWVGVANGELESRTTVEGDTVTHWHLSEPAASYLVTVAIGNFEMTSDKSSSGVPITYWTPRDRPKLVKGLASAPAGLDWLEARLGPYPFDSLGIVLVDSLSGMETQTMITLGITDYTTSPGVLVHEMAHQWYGDVVTPNDWRDVWMNEGMAMYLEGLYDADKGGDSVESVLGYWASFEPQMRRVSGPPADYDPSTFGEGNIYYGPALMWDELRKRIGYDAFFALASEWPHVHEDGNASRDDYLPWLEEQTGLELTSFFDSWLLGKRSPPRS
ncbi:M1 family metallopeptidase [Nocardioides sp.]|uniref:M1 family metallopeptidase n=1 Tax=Nocardioides sp. TaxID=35761 RepID=UPI0031FE9B19|nr:pepN 3 [Nocardioides sp.]